MHRRRTGHGDDRRAPQLKTPAGLVVVDHGSRVRRANEAFEDFVHNLASRPDTPAIVEPAHMEIASPSIADAVERCVAAGAKTIVVCPYFLAEGRHSREDVPRLAADAVAGHAGVGLVITDVVGVSPAMSDVVGASFRAAVSD